MLEKIKKWLNLHGVYKINTSAFHPPGFLKFEAHVKKRFLKPLFY